nr:TonB-dependent receptor [Saprospiraceae bacterium]
MKVNCIVFLLSLFLGMATVDAQEGSRISGFVFDQSGEALSFSTVALYHQGDSTLARAEYTDTDGAFQLTGVNAGSYYLHLSYVGIPSMILRDIEVEPGRDLDMGEIVMNSEGMDLNEVVVTTTKPLIEVRADKTIFNVEASITAAGSDGWELLRKAPGVMIDNNDQIQIRGKSGVLIQIDGKNTYLTQEELANLLRSVDASDIERIEVITNPSARYEASGNSGIINIVMKVSKGLGTNGSLSLSGAYGKQYRAYSSLNLNHRAEKFNIYGSLGGGHSRWENGLNLYRLQNDRIFDQKQVQVGKSTPINTRLGMDLYIGPKHTIGFMGSLNTHIGDSDI